MLKNISLSFRRLLGLGCVLYASAAPAQVLLVKPYVQHGDEGPLGVTDSKVVAWTTDNVAADDFAVEYGPPGDVSVWKRVAPTRVMVRAAAGKPVKPTPAQLKELMLDDAPSTLPAHGTASAAGATLPAAITIPANPPVEMLHYRADLTGLPLSSSVGYRVRKGGATVLAAEFRTRRPAGEALEFVVFGDNARGLPDQRKIAYQMHLQKPEMILNVGDNVYTEGRISQYMKHFWSDYCNTDEASEKKGAPLMRSVPYYIALGNHDVAGSDLQSMPDGMAVFLFFHFPLNGPTLKGKASVKGPPERVAWFKEGAGARFPRMSHYSFDSGPAHFVAIDANKYLDINETAFREWLAADLAGTKLPWKIVFFHQPPFSLTPNHVDEQRMRAFAPLLEAAGVQVVFSGHAHNYERTKPLRYAPNTTPDGKVKPESSGRVSGRMQVDEAFDGKTVTRPDGVVYIISGAGGGGLHNDKATGKPEKWPHFLANYVGDRHSFTRVSLSPERCVLRQLDDKGGVIDEVAITRK